MKVAQKNTPVKNTLSVGLPHPPNIPNVEPSPLRTVCPINGPVLLECPDEFIPNTNVSQNRSISTDTPPLTFVRYTRHPRPDPSPLRTPCPVITPEPAIHRQMNSRSELKSSYHVSSSITFICHALHCLICVLCIYCFSPLFYCPVVSTTAAGAPVIDYVVDDRTPLYRRASRQAEPFPSPTYRLLFYNYLLH